MTMYKGLNVFHTALLQKIARGQWTQGDLDVPSGNYTLSDLRFVRLAVKDNIPTSIPGKLWSYNDNRILYITIAVTPLGGGPIWSGISEMPQRLVPSGGGTATLSVNDRNLQLDGINLNGWDEANSDLYNLNDAVGGVHKDCMPANVFGYHLDYSPWPPSFYLTPAGMQKIRNLVDAAYAMQTNQNWIVAFGLGNEPNSTAGFRINTATNRAEIAAWYPMQAATYANLWKQVMGYLVDYAATKGGWAPPLVLGEVAHYVDCWSAELDEVWYNYTGVPGYQQGYIDTRYINLVLYYYYRLYGSPSVTNPWLSAGGRPIQPGTFHVHRYGAAEDPRSFLTYIRNAVNGSNDPKALNNPSNLSGQAPFNTPAMRYGLSEYAGYMPGGTPPNNVNADTWLRNIFASSNMDLMDAMWNQGLRTMYWYADYEDYGDNDWMSIFTGKDAVATRTSLPLAGDALRDFYSS